MGCVNPAAYSNFLFVFGFLVFFFGYPAHVYCTKYMG